MLIQLLPHLSKALCLLLMMLTTSCVSTKNKPLAEASVLAGKSATRTSRDLPDFAAMTAGKVTLGMVGGLAMIATGNGIVRENGVEDPADWISAELAAEMAKKHSTKLMGQTRISGESPKDMAAAGAAKGADYVLDVRTINWSFIYFPMNWGTYGVIYSAKLRLIDCKSGVVLAEGFYASLPEKREDSPSYDGLVDNKAAGLKRELRAGAAKALQHFRENVLRL